MLFNIIYGYRTRNTVLGQTQYVCQKCQQNSAHTVIRKKTYMTLFFVQLFPISTSTVARCDNCGRQDKMNNKQADAMYPQAAKL